MKVNAVVEFIKAHPGDWKELLTKEPYCLKIKNKDNLFIFSYNQIESDFSSPVVQQARGLILRVIQLPDYPELDVSEGVSVDVCCWPFDKFFNIGESQAADIDWASASILEKVDGSIIKYWFDHNTLTWRVSTNGMIDAFECDLQMTDDKITSFGDLFMSVAGNSLQTLADELCTAYTYIFELVSPFNRVVVPYKEPDVYLIGIRNNATGEEISPLDSVLAGYFRLPKPFDFSTKEAMLATIEELPYDSEGYVVCDAWFNRVKVKGLAYLRMHRLKDANGQFSNKRVFEIVKAGESEEVLAYFPEHRPAFQRIAEAYDKLLVSIAAAQAAALGYKDRGITKKEFAEVVKKELPALRPYMFATWDGKSIQPYLDKISVDDI